MESHSIICPGSAKPLIDRNILNLPISPLSQSKPKSICVHSYKSKLPPESHEVSLEASSCISRDTRQIALNWLSQEKSIFVWLWRLGRMRFGDTQWKNLRRHRAEPSSSYSALVTHIASKSGLDARSEPPRQTPSIGLVLHPKEKRKEKMKKDIIICISSENQR